MDWRDEYRKKFVSPEEAVRVVKSGDTVCIPIDTPALALSRALRARKGELENVAVMLRQPREKLGWLEDDLGGAFQVLLDTQIGDEAKALNEKKTDYLPFLTSLRFKESRDKSQFRPVDVVFIVISPPDEKGFCSFGLYLSHKRDYARTARVVLAEVSDAPEMTVRIPSDTKIHVSEVDFFTKHVPPLKESAEPKEKKGPGEAEKRVSEYVASLIRDGDTLQFGPGGVLDALVPLGTFDGKKDLGIHSALMTSGIVELVRRGIVTGKRKNVNPRKSVGGGFRRLKGKKELSFIEGNEHFFIGDMSYVNDIRVIASNDNMVAINSVLAVDLTGQIAADSLGTRMFGGAGGQVEFAIGAMLSNGGHSITALRSTAGGGKISRIVPTFEEGTVVTIPRIFADYVVTEYGIASLMGRSQRERVEALIAIAHPDFRAELRKQAEKLY